MTDETRQPLALILTRQTLHGVRIPVGNLFVIKNLKFFQLGEYFIRLVALLKIDVWVGGRLVPQMLNRVGFQKERASRHQPPADLAEKTSLGFEIGNENSVILHERH